MTQENLFSNDWAVHSGYEPLRQKLDELVPFKGKCEFPRSKNKNLEKFRIAQNLLYDLFNNGLGNRRSEFRRFFGFVPVPSIRYEVTQTRWKQIEDEMEPIFTDIIIKAAKEQKIQNN